MPAPISTAIDDLTGQARAKAAAVRRPGRYLVSSALAGAYIGVAVIVLISVSAPLRSADSPVTTLVSGAVFGIALTLVVFAGAELFTGNVMTMMQGWLARRVSWTDVIGVCVASFLGNLVGSIAFGFLVHASGTLTRTDPGRSFIGSLVDAKAAAAGGELFARAVLCNMLVCLALWMAARTTGDGAKLAVLWWPLLAFIVAGFEHCVANMTIFTLGVATGDATWAELARNLVYTVPGNLLGGAVVVGIGYWYVDRGARRAPVVADEIDLAPATVSR